MIDKVLARYSGEFTVFRELLQNSDDAQSKVVEIRFQTRDFVGTDEEGPANNGDKVTLPDLKKILVCFPHSSFSVSNIGHRFIGGCSRTTESHSETKIGAASRKSVRLP